MPAGFSLPKRSSRDSTSTSHESRAERRRAFSERDHLAVPRHDVTAERSGPFWDQSALIAGQRDPTADRRDVAATSQSSDGRAVFIEHAPRSFVHGVP